MYERRKTTRLGVSATTTTNNHAGGGDMDAPDKQRCRRHPGALAHPATHPQFPIYILLVQTVYYVIEYRSCHDTEYCHDA